MLTDVAGERRTRGLRRYLLGAAHGDPSGSRSGDVPPGRRQLFMLTGVAVFLLGIGALLGVWLAPESPAADKRRIGELRAELSKAHARIAELERDVAYGKTNKAPTVEGRLSRQDRARHLRKGREYARALRRVKAQSAAQLMEWFVGRWNQLLDQPQEDDRVTRRAATLAMLVGGMAETLNPDDYVPWQAELFSSKWLGELHFDLDGDGLPGKRSGPNTRDSFADSSICHIAMALNQAVTDAQILLMPDMRCKSREADVSVFLAGNTLDDALDEFVRAATRQRFLIKERMVNGVRLILLGGGVAPSPWMDY